MLIVLKNINSFNFKKKDEIFLKLSAISTKMKEIEILITLKFNTLISIVCFEKKRLIKFNIKLILIVYSDEKQLIMITKNVIIYTSKRVAAKIIKNVLLLKQTYCKKLIESFIKLVDFIFFNNQFVINI